MGIIAKPESKHCQRCGEPLAGAELSGNCPRCLATLLLSPEPADAVDSTPIPILRRLGDYELLEEVARGGMGVVFRARQVSLDRVVAVKLLRDSALARPEDVKRFRAEAASVARLKHPNIVAIHEVGEDQGQHYLAMDLVAGPNLAQLTRDGPLESHGAAEITARIADAVQHAHSQGILHRDLKPSNVLRDTEGEVFVTDFGLARPLDTGSSLTLTGQMLGTPAYMSPEQAGGLNDSVGPAADVYALGALLFHLLTGRPPFVSNSLPELLRHVAKVEPLSPQLLNSSVPRDLATVCLKCLAKRPAERYGSAREFAEDLRRYLCNQPVRARPASYTERLCRWCRREPALAMAVVALLLVGLMGLAGIWWQWQRALKEARQAQLNAYCADMNLTARAVEENNLDVAVESLDRYRPKTNARDIRGWEWRYLWRHCQSDALDTIGWHSNEVRVVVFAPASQTLITGSRDATLKFWEVGTWRLKRTFPLEAGVRSMALSSDGQQLVVSMENGKVRLWELPEMKQLFPKESSAWNAANRLAFAPDNKAFAIGGRRGQVQIVDTSSGQVTHTLAAGQDMIRALAFSPDGALLASGCQNYQDNLTNSLVLWNAKTWTPVASFNPHPWLVTVLRFSPDGSLLASGGWEDSVKLWNTRTFQLVGTLKGHSLPIFALTFSSDGSLLASGSTDQTIILWDVATREAITRYQGHLGDVWSLEYSSDDTALVSGGADGTVRLWKGKPTPRESDFVPLPAGIASTFTSHAAGIGAAATSLGTIQVWDMPAARNIGSVTGQVAALTANGLWLASASNEGKITIFAVSNLQAVAQFSIADKAVSVMEFDAAGERLAIAGKDGHGVVCNWTRQEDVASWKVNATCRTLAFSPDGQILALGLTDGVIEFRNAGDGKLSRTLTGHKSGVLGSSFSSDGRWFVSGGVDASVRIWEVRTGRQLALLKADRTGVYNVGFSPDMSRVVTSAMDGTIRLWNFATRQQVLTLKGHRIKPALAFVDEDRQLISLSVDGIRYWRAPSLAQIEATEAKRKLK